ncbi:bis(5'-nucleosyl)-tetraphosphatase (symmetrical) YqeK [Anaerosoma tenue]|uniref:bis(5'-nucleosyl)-tetraphosphatase (symmetrical) YqeK n=1 Tax=Anaerosoma tenue TaxID=2933588 RepID=UPI002260B0A7|nr:bis(5'-nucleosyl)-tetraphosphatase (symmetrical) YqeK [Anaerosoma tenue]MCK8114035.1 bis(5'-nucleosyl)-tetraphosphatase (symmetrical) YqeK [Anaerosoma tenue]
MATSYEAAQAAIIERLSPEAARHCERVASVAARLAQRHGLDAEEARVAGLLHDWDRETPGAELLRRAERLGLPVTDTDRAVPYLLHGPVAAAEIREVFPELSDTAVEAIGAHTFGAPHMGALAMVVYIADVIEPGRTHDGVGLLRERAESAGLAEAFADAYAASVRHIVKRRKPIHPTTVDVWNTYVAGDGR